MSTRSQWLRNKAQHDQRELTYVEPKKVDHDESTAWIPAFSASLAGIPKDTALTVNSILVLGLGEDAKARELKLRQLSRIGILHMGTRRDSLNNFVEYVWFVEDLF